jgi:hypothetical protein
MINIVASVTRGEKYLLAYFLEAAARSFQIKYEAVSRWLFTTFAKITWSDRVQYMSDCSIFLRSKRSH